MFYDSKFHRSAPADLHDTDLYTVLPKSATEPIYVKPHWEREQQMESIEPRHSEEIKQATFGSIEAGTLFGPDRMRKS